MSPSMEKQMRTETNNIAASIAEGGRLDVAEVEYNTEKSFWNMWRDGEIIQDSTLKEREEMSEMLQSCTQQVKRIVAPMLDYIIVQEILVDIYFSAEGKQETMMDWIRREKADDRLTHLQLYLRNLGDKVRDETYMQRKEEWEDMVREQVDYLPQEAKEKRVISETECAEMLSLANEMRQAGVNHWSEHNYSMTVTSNIQILQLLKEVRCSVVNGAEELAEYRRRAHKNLSIACLKTHQWNKAKQNADKLLSENPNDLDALIRRSECFFNLGRFKYAIADLRYVIDSEFPLAETKYTEDSHSKLVRMAKKKMRKISMKGKANTQDLKGLASKGLGKGTFSDSRASRPEKKPLQKPRLPYYLEKQRAEGKLSADEYDEMVMHQMEAHANGPTKLPTASNSTKTSPPSPPRTDLEMEPEVVEEIQRQQLKIFKKPDAQKKLNQMRRDVDFEERRFLRKFQPLKIELQSQLLDNFGFSADAIGMKSMERGISQHTRDREVLSRHKKLQVLIMGDIWEGCESDGD